MKRKCLNLVSSFDICSNFEVTEEAVSLIGENLMTHVDSFGEELKITWFVRADNQLKSMFGDETHLLHKYKRLLNGLSNRGHEIGWHPHVYRRSRGDWILETRDDILGKKLTSSYEKVSESFDVSCVRMGESYHSNFCMRTLDKLGLKVDSTALPGRKRLDDGKTFDWIGTPTHPYHPCMRDYRRPGKANLGILEVPMSMISVKASYDKTPLLRYFNLSYYHALIESGARAIIEENDLIVTTTHPYELVSSSGNRHPLVSYDIKEAKKNLSHIIRCCEAIGRPVRFITMSEVPDAGGALP